MVTIFTRPTKTRTNNNEKIEVEKGIDVRIAIDIIKDVLHDKLKAIVIFSQDQDLSEITQEIRHLSKRKITIYSAFPFSDSSSNKRGINGSKWIQISKDDYDQCIDYRDYIKQ